MIMDPWSKGNYSRHIREASMVEGKLPEGRSSLQQGAGKGPDGAPDLGSMAAAKQRRDREKGFPFRKFHVTENI